MNTFPTDPKLVLKAFIESMQMLTADEIDLIIENTVVKFFKKGDFLLREGEIAQSCYFVLKGCIREYYLVDGEERVSNFYTEGMPVNSFTSYSKKLESKHFWETSEDTFVTVGTQQLEDEMCARIPRLEQLIRQEVERNTGKAQDDFAQFMISTPEERYLNLMKTRPDLLNRVPQHQIASYIGVKPESLSRIRKRMVSTTR